MEKKNDINDSFNEIIIYKPKPKRLCPPRKKINFLSSSSSSSLEISHIQLDLKEKKLKVTNLNNISLEEIKNDFLVYEKNLEEEECTNELWNILNNSSENNFSDKINQNSSRVKRCKNTFEEKNFEYLNNCDIDDLFNEFNDMISNQN